MQKLTIFETLYFIKNALFLWALTQVYSSPIKKVGAYKKYIEKKICILFIVLQSSNVPTYKPRYHYQNFSPLANGTDLNREKYAILQTHWH